MASHIVCKLQRKLEYMYELLNSDDAGICSCSRDRMLVAEAGQRLGLFLKSVRVAVSCSVPASQQHLASPPHHHVREISLSGLLAGAAIPCAAGAPECCRPDEDKQLNKRCKVRARGSGNHRRRVQTRPMAPSLRCSICIDHAGRGRGIFNRRMR